jgi:hypothetical protein
MIRYVLDGIEAQQIWNRAIVKHTTDMPHSVDVFNLKFLDPKMVMNV